MKKNKITFAVIIAAEIAAIVISLVVFNGLFSLWAVCLLAVELAAATMFFIHAESHAHERVVIIIPKVQ